MGPCSDTATVEDDHSQPRQLGDPGNFVGESRSAGRLDCRGWPQVVAAYLGWTTLATSSHLFVGEKTAVVDPHSGHTCVGWGPGRSQTGRPPSQAGPGSMGVQRHNPVDSCCLGMAFTVFSCQEQQLQATCELKTRQMTSGVSFSWGFMTLVVFLGHYGVQYTEALRLSWCLLKGLRQPPRVSPHTTCNVDL